MCKPLFIITASRPTTPGHGAETLSSFARALGRFGYADLTHPTMDQVAPLTTLHVAIPERDGSTYQTL
ncbi:MAG: hypothetical protein ABJF88_14595 [Rhodothermales bacterium]